MATLPRGILEIRRKNKDGSTTVKYRVRIVRKDFKEDKVFDNLQEAKEFLALSKVKKGKELIYKISEEERQKNNSRNEQLAEHDYTLSHFIKLYIQKNVTKGLDDDEIKLLPELDRRNIGNKRSFFKTIQNTSIIDQSITYHEKEAIGFDGDMPLPRFFGAFDVRKIGPIHINDYIEERTRKGIKKSSISREVSHISNVFKKLYLFDPSLDKLENPTLKLDKDLLIDRNKVNRTINLTPQEQQQLLEELGKKNNKEMLKIATISILTSLRRCEIVTLTKPQVFHNYIIVTRGKNGNQRNVYIDEKAQEYIKSLQLIPDTEKYFNYTIAGFGKMFYDFLKAQKLQGKFRFHDFRRIAITNKILEMGASNSIFISEFLGMASERKLKELHIDTIVSAPQTQADHMKNFAHSSTATTKIYFSIPNYAVTFDLNKLKKN